MGEGIGIEQIIAARAGANLGKRNFLLLRARQAGNIDAEKLRCRGDGFKPFLVGGALDDFSTMGKARYERD